MKFLLKRTEVEYYKILNGEKTKPKFIKSRAEAESDRDCMSYCKSDFEIVCSRNIIANLMWT